jgi:H+-transporting ATPase
MECSVLAGLDVFGSEATLYSIRERRRLWSSRPSLWVVVSTVCDILIISTLVTRGSP